jgi:hypothetical protein
MVTTKTSVTCNNLLYILVDRIEMTINVTNIIRKEQVIELHLKGLSQREIAKTLKMSLRDVSSIMKEFESKKDNVKPEKSNVAKAIQMYMDDKSPNTVVVELDISPAEAESIYADYLRLANRYAVTELFCKIKDLVPEFITYYKIVRKNNGDDKEKIKIKRIIDNDYILSKQEQKKHEQDLENEKSLEFKIKLEMDIQRLRQEYEYFNS